MTQESTLDSRMPLEGAELNRGDLTKAEWRVLMVLLPVELGAGERGRGRPPEDNRVTITAIVA